MVAFFCGMYLYIYDYFFVFINSNYLLKLQRLLHDRIDPTVEELRKKPQSKKFKRVQRFKSSTSAPPIGTPDWCLNEEALRRFNRSTNEIPIYDYNTDQDENDEYRNNNKNDKRENKKRKDKKNKKKRAKKHRKD
jgi:hypothetical protein